MNEMKRTIFILLIAVIAVIVSIVFFIKQPEPELMTIIVPPELASFFDGFDANNDKQLSWDEGMEFYYWMKYDIKYRYDDERDPEGLQRLEAGDITRAQLGDGRPGGEYWQRPIETLGEGYGDCDDMAILNLAFYSYFNVESYLAIVDVDGDGEIDHAICIVWFGITAYEELKEVQGVITFYDIEGKPFVIVDAAYSEEYGFIGTTCPWTGIPLPAEIADFTLYRIYTLSEIYNERWA